MKYKQRGYRDDEHESTKRQSPREPEQPDLGNREQIRSLRHGIDRNTTVVTRCGRCGHQVPTSQLEVDHQSTCSKCDTPLHSCRHCIHFDPAEPNECREPVEARIADKWAANECGIFRPVQALDATGRRADTTVDARSAFHNLFKS